MVRSTEGNHEVKSEDVACGGGRCGARANCEFGSWGGRLGSVTMAVPLSPLPPALCVSASSPPWPRRAALASAMPLAAPAPILLVGVTGGTGASLVHGLLASGVAPSQLRALTRSPHGAAARTLADLGVQPVAGDLDDPSCLPDVLHGRPIDSVPRSTILRVPPIIILSLRLTIQASYCRPVA